MLEGVGVGKGEAMLEGVGVGNKREGRVKRCWCR